MTNGTDFPLAQPTIAPLPDGRLRVRQPDGSEHEAVLAVRAFPLSAPDEGVSLVDAAGHEVLWIDRLADLAQAPREAVLAALADREFMPRISRLIRVSTYATPSTWTVATDRGQTDLVLAAEEDIRRLGDGAAVVTDRHGVNYLIEDIPGLDAASRRMLDRFL
ncbi:MAG: DUF1854 domain-containing protein [Burkholderiaceae bacterium]